MRFTIGLAEKKTETMAAIGCLKKYLRMAALSRGRKEESM